MRHFTLSFTPFSSKMKTLAVHKDCPIPLLFLTSTWFAGQGSEVVSHTVSSQGLVVSSHSGSVLTKSH